MILNLDFMVKLLIAMFVFLNIGFLIKFHYSGASIVVAFKSLFRLYTIPLILIYISDYVVKNKRKIIYDMKSEKEYSEKKVRRMEFLLSSRTVFLMCFVLVTVLDFRSVVDHYVRISIEYEKEKARRKKFNTQKNSPKFWDHIIRKIDIERHIFS
ncbi:hypothetical protein D478_14810 [Brevibacillus agri BAB-2500]|nr:hypothetical protein D478_14810 [Brevibacillus agri BAB-2500]